MKHVYRISIALSLYLVVVWLCRSSSPGAASAAAAPAPVAPVSDGHTGIGYFPGHGLSAEEARAYKEAIEQRTLALREQEQARARRERAAENLIVSRKVNQQAAFPAWQKVLKTYDAKFRHLKALADKAPDRQVPCTICDGFSYMPCVMCHHHDGRCSTCLGSGQRGDDLCASCSGSTKCYLCAGSGKMLCPFCNDAMIEADGPEPAALPPLQ